MNKYGAVLDDFGLEAMLNQFMEEFIAPISKGYLISCCVVVVDRKRHYWFHCFNISSTLIYVLCVNHQFFTLRLVGEHWTLIMLLLLNMGKTEMLNLVRYDYHIQLLTKSFEVLRSLTVHVCLDVVMTFLSY